jgi:RNA-binding protein
LGGQDGKTGSLNKIASINDILRNCLIIIRSGRQENEMRTLTGKQVRHLRGLGHKLKPVVMIGRGDISPQVLAAVEENLAARELIKIKVQEGCNLDRREVAAEVAMRTEAFVVQILGRTILLYRPGEDKIIDLP